MPEGYEDEAEQRKEGDHGFGDAASRYAEHPGMVSTSGFLREISGNFRGSFPASGPRDDMVAGGLGCYPEGALRQI